MSKTKKVPKIKRKIQPSSSKKKGQLAALKPGDRIWIIAPGSHAAPETLQQGIQVLQSWGFDVQVEPDLLEPKIFLANSDKKRFAAFKKAFNDPKAKAVWCLRGGYGAIRLLPLLAKMKKPAKKKLLIGLSDISSLHAFITQKWGWSTLHGPLIDRLALNKLTEENVSELRKVLHEPSYVSEFSNLEPLNKAASKKKSISGQLTGGNLMVVTSTLGTPFQQKTEGKILFLEELAERAYRVDRCLQQMKQAGLFTGVKAVVFGDFTDCHEPNKDNHILETLRDFFADLNVPAFTGVECGHGLIQRPLFFNTEVHLACGTTPKMLIYSAFEE